MTQRPLPDGPPEPDLKILSTQVYRGPNVWSFEPAIHLVVDLGVLEGYPTDTLPGFTDTLLSILPGVGDHACSRSKRGGFAERMREGTWLGHVAEHVALQLQAEAGHDTRRGKTRGNGTEGQYHVIYAYTDEKVGRAAGELAVRLVNHLVKADPEFHWDAEFEDFLLLAQRTAFGPSTQALIDEAVSRDIPWMRLNEGSLVQLGHGKYAKRIRATMTSDTSSLGVDIASDKELTGKLLAAAGLPVPQPTSVRTVSGALKVARRFGFPVVVKPLDGNHGRGVCLNLNSEAEVEAAFPIAYGESRGGYVVVEKYITGKDYRCLVIGGRIAAVAERVPAHVVGNGTDTVRQLVADVNADPRRGVGHEKVLTRIKINDAAIELVRDQGFELEDVPPAGTTVYLTLTGNMSTGGISIDRTLDAHPDNVDIAEEAARVVGLDVAGIDFIAPDITQSVRDVGGAIVEVNAAPGFRMHTHPTIGEPQYIAKPVLDLLFPPGARSRVPIIGVTGTNGKTTTSRMIAHIFKGLGKKVGMTSTDGVVIDERLLIKSDASGPKSARMVLQNPRVDFAVLEVARGGILREGLGYDRNDVAVVLNVAADHLGLRGIDTVEQLADVKSVVVEAVPRDGFAVLNADDPLVANMARRCAGEVVWFSASAPGTPERERIERHLRRGGRAVVLEHTDLGDSIVLRHGRRSMQVAWTHLLPATFGGKAKFNVLNAMAAAGAAFAAGATLNDIRQGLRTFTTNYYLAPGRLNQIDVHGITVFVDYAHNPAGLNALGEFVGAFADGMEANSPTFLHHRRIGSVGTAGDRRDEDLRELGRVAAEHFDVVVIREDKNRRGRALGEAARIVHEGVTARLAEGGARAREVLEILDEIEATRVAISHANAGDVVALCVDKTSDVYQQLEAMAQTAMPGKD